MSPAGCLGFATDPPVPPYFTVSGFPVSVAAVFQSREGVSGAANIGSALGFRVADVTDLRVAHIDKVTGAITFPSLVDSPDGFRTQVPGFPEEMAYVACGVQPLTGPWSRPGAVKDARAFLKAQQHGHSAP